MPGYPDLPSNPSTLDSAFRVTSALSHSSESLRPGRVSNGCKSRILLRARLVFGSSALGRQSTFQIQKTILKPISSRLELEEIPCWVLNPTIITRETYSRMIDLYLYSSTLAWEMNPISLGFQLSVRKEKGKDLSLWFDF